MIATVNRDINLLCPALQDILSKALIECNDSGYPVELFEGFRSPERQEELYAQGRTAPGSVVTKSRAWQSFHQYGLAADIVFKRNGKWSWDGDWAGVHKIIKNYNLETLSWEKPHVQLTHGITWQEALHITKTHGLQSLWVRISSNS